MSSDDLKRELAKRLINEVLPIISDLPADFKVESYQSEAPSSLPSSTYVSIGLGDGASITIRLWKKAGA